MIAKWELPKERVRAFWWQGTEKGRQLTRGSGSDGTTDHSMIWRGVAISENGRRAEEAKSVFGPYKQNLFCTNLQILSHSTYRLLERVSEQATRATRDK